VFFDGLNPSCLYWLQYALRHIDQMSYLYVLQYFNELLNPRWGQCGLLKNLFVFLLPSFGVCKGR